MDKLELFPCGSQVTIKDTMIMATITAQCNRFGYIEYEVSYIWEGVHYAYWMHETEFSCEVEKRKIGF